MMIDTDRTLGHYKMVSSLGAGGMGEVYLATDTRLERKAAIKLLTDEFSKNADRLHRFTREAKAASALNHPDILTIYDIGESDGTPLRATEYIEGETLCHHLQHSRLTKPSGSFILIKLLAQPYQNLGEKHEYTSS